MESARRTNTTPIKVVFIHLDLGIGGAEQLVLSLAGASQAAGHNVTIVTSRCDQDHCFSPVKKPFGKLASSVQVCGRFLPANLAGMATALCSSLRMLYLSFWTIRTHHDADILVMDVLPTSIPFLASLTMAGVLFYCHFPDKLLTRDTVNGEPTDAGAQRSMLRNLYRSLLDSLEESTMSYSDVLVVNSNFTRSKVQQVFPSLQQKAMKVLYPALEMDKFAKPTFEISKDAPIVSLNRFERKKNIQLLLQSYAYLKGKVVSSLPPLIIAGGYDTQNAENVEYLHELKQLAKDLNIHVTFKTSVSDDERSELMTSCLCLVYTPHLEHFGIVPLEAMYAGRPVVAVNSGGPMETIVHEKTGYLCEGTPEAFGQALLELVQNPKKAMELGKAGHEHVVATFGVKRFEREWVALVRETSKVGKKRWEINHARYCIFSAILHVMEAGFVLLVVFLLTQLLRRFGVLRPDAQILGSFRRFLMGTDEL